MKMKHGKPVIAVTIGDANGIGPEVVLKSMGHRDVRRLCAPLLVGPEEVFASYARRLGMDLFTHRRRGVPPAIPGLVDIPVRGPLRIRPGMISASAGRIAARALEVAVTMARVGLVEGVVTAPVSKQALHRAGVMFPGQTEMLQRLTHSPRVAMMLVTKRLKIGLATVHIPLSRVPRAITRTGLTERIRTIHDALVGDWGIRKPRIAVLGLNPHAGEGGDMGSEEKRLIVPVVRALQRGGMAIQGPFPADAFFARYRAGVYDGVIAMYHDQGLIPLKMSAGGKGVNVSVGLSIVRTSPDHGTAFDIAGKGVARPDSMIEAIILAARIAIRRRRNEARKLP